MRVLLLVILTLLNWALTLGVQLADHRHLTAAQRARAWNGATWGVAIYWFGLFSMVPWAWVTRQRWRAWREGGLVVALARSAWLLLRGAGAAALLLLVLTAAEAGLATALGVTLE